MKLKFSKNTIYGILIFVVVLLIVNRIYKSTDYYQFKTAQSNKDYKMLWLFLEENPESKYVPEAQLLAIESLESATKKQEIFKMLYSRQRYQLDEKLERIMKFKSLDNYVSNRIPATAEQLLSASWATFDEFILYMMVQHSNKFADLPNANTIHEKIATRAEQILSTLEYDDNYFLERCDFLVAQLNESNIRLGEDKQISLQDKFIKHVNLIKVDTNLNERKWIRIKSIYDNYHNNISLRSALVEKIQERILYRLEHKLGFYMSDYHSLVKLDSSKTWRPLENAYEVYKDRLDSLSKIKTQLNIKTESKEEARINLSKISKVQVNLISDLGSQKYEAVVADGWGTTRLVIQMVVTQVYRLGLATVVIQHMSDNSGYNDALSNKPIPLYIEYIGDYETLMSEYAEIKNKLSEQKSKSDRATVTLKEQQQLFNSVLKQWFKSIKLIE